MDERAWDADYHTRDLVPESMGSIEEGVLIDAEEERLRRVTIFNVPIGEPRYVEEILRNNTIKVTKVTMDYARDLEEEYPHELWTMYSLHHRVTYWL